MNRRTLLRRSSALSVAFLAGCNDTPSYSSTRSPPNDTSESTTDQSTESTTPTPERTTDDTPQLAVEQQYELGNSHSTGDWSVAVTSISLATTFQLDHDDATYQMSNSEQLAIVTVEITNTAGSRKAWTDAPFAIVADSQLFDERLGFEHPDFDDPVQMDDLAQVDHVRRYAPSGHPVEGGETVRSWVLFVLPRNIIREEIEVGFDDERADDAAYPIRWIPRVE